MLLVVLIVVGDEVEVEYLVLDGLLGVEGTCRLLEAFFLCEQRRADGIEFEYFFHFGHQLVDGGGSRMHGKLGVRRVVDLRHVAHHVGLVDVGGGEVDGFLIDGEQCLLLLRRLRVGLLQGGEGVYGGEIVFCHLAASLLTGVLPHAYALQFHVAQKDAVEVEGHVGAHGAYLRTVVLRLVG